jgi:hypothetical protein
MSGMLIHLQKSYAASVALAAMKHRAMNSVHEIKIFPVELISDRNMN